jgi:hypothetical protein
LAVSGRHGARRGPWLGVLLLATMALAAVRFGTPALAEVGPLPAPPCASDGTEVVPPFADPPAARVWHRHDLAGWKPPACFAWPPLAVNLVTAVSGQIKSEDGADELLGRFAAVSGWKGMRYWSASDRSWETFITDSVALADPSPQKRRPDFTPAELKSGADFYFLRSDASTSDPVIYRMRVAEATPDRLVVTIGNVSAVRRLIFTLFEAGDIQSTYFLEKIGPGLWGYYALTVMHEGPMVIGNHDDAFLTRTLSIYRHLAGIPTDQNPPLLP